MGYTITTYRAETRHRIRCATASYPTNMMASIARIRLTSDCRAHVEVAAHDVGTGAYTAMQQIAARLLGLDPRRVTVALGDTHLPPGPVAGGSMTTASAGSAIHVAVGKIAQRFGGSMPQGDETIAGFRGEPFAPSGREMVERAEVIRCEAGLPSTSIPKPLCGRSAAHEPAENLV